MKNTTKILKPITKRSYRILLTKLHNAEAKASWALGDEAAPAQAAAQAAKDKIEAYSVDCSGSAHDPEVGGMIDNCLMCAPRWGRTFNRELVK